MWCEQPGGGWFECTAVAARVDSRVDDLDPTVVNTGQTLSQPDGPGISRVHTSAQRHRVPHHEHPQRRIRPLAGHPTPGRRRRLSGVCLYTAARLRPDGLDRRVCRSLKGSGLGAETGQRPRETQTDLQQDRHTGDAQEEA